MQKRLLLFGFFIFSLMLKAQDVYNLDFEKISPATKTPQDWDITLKIGGTQGYISTLDSTHAFKDKYCLSMESDPAATFRTFGACSYSIKKTYAGSKIQLKGYVKTEGIDSTGVAALWLRLDGRGEVLDFGSTEKLGLNGSHDWKEYTIDLDYNDESLQITIGAIIKGKTGRVWIDNLRLLIDGQPIEQAVMAQAKSNIKKALLDSGFYSGSKILIPSLSQQDIKDLTLLGQTWGFLKYYHPQITSGNYNWDFELFRFLPTFLNGKQSSERQELMTKWIEDLGTLPHCTTCNVDTTEFKQMPDFSWFLKKPINKNLQRKLVEVKNNRNQKNSFYIQLASNIGNPMFKNENSYEKFSFPDTGFRLLALYRYWNMVNYFYPYKYLTGNDWNEILETHIQKFINCNSEIEYKLAVLDLIRSVNDTHAGLFTDQAIKNYLGSLAAPVQLKFIEGQAVVTNYYSKEPGQKSEMEAGDILKTIDGKSIEKIIREKSILYTASNEPTRLRNMARDLLRGNDSKVKVTFIRNGKSYKKTLIRVPLDKLDRTIDFTLSPSPDSCYRFLDTDRSIGYIYVGTITEYNIPKIIEAFKDTKGVIIDMRAYPNQFLVYSLGEFFVPREKEFVKFSIGDTRYPGAFHWGQTLKLGGKREDKLAYSGKVVILVNEVTQSQGEYTTMAFQASPNTTVIGSTTAGADGNISGIYLPGKVYTMISGIGVYYPDGKETQRVGIVPNIEVKPSIKGIREHRDELLEEAVHYLNKSINP